MYARNRLPQIRRLEGLLYQGPETVEHVYEREDRFEASHLRRRNLAYEDRPLTRSTEAPTIVIQGFELTYDTDTERCIWRRISDE